MDNSDTDAARALNSIIELLSGLDDTGRERVFSAAARFFQFDRTPQPANRAEVGALSRTRPSFSEHNSPSPKEFLLQKQPKTDVERIACLAYYLTHYRDIPYFKTLDLAKLNTEAAQPKFSNAAYAAANAATLGYLAPGTKGQRQISAAGEQFVVALPDRDAARAAMTSARRKRANRKKK